MAYNYGMGLVLAKLSIRIILSTHLGLGGFLAWPMPLLNAGEIRNTMMVERQTVFL